MLCDCCVMSDMEMIQCVVRCGGVMRCGIVLWCEICCDLECGCGVE